MATYFHTYVGAIYITKGQPTVETWIAKLIDPDAGTPTQPWQQFGTQGTTSNNTSSATASTSNSGPSMSNPMLPVTPDNVPVFLVNQTAMQRGVAVNYVATQDGPSHIPTWTVRCYSKWIGLFLRYNIFFNGFTCSG